MFHKPQRIFKRSTTSVEKPVALTPESEPVQVDVKAQKALEQARAIYQETRDPEHWQYMQRCIDRVQKR